MKPAPTPKTPPPAPAAGAPVEETPGVEPRGRWWRRMISIAIALGLCGFAAFVLHKEIAGLSYDDLRTATSAIPRSHIVIAILLTFTSYFVLTGYDTLALRSIGIDLSYRRTVLASFLGFVFSHNLGLSAVGGSAVRYRIYGSFGLTFFNVVKVFAFCAATFWLGLIALSDFVLLVAPDLIAARLELPLLAARALGLFGLLLVTGYVVLCARRKEPLRIRQWTFELPTLRIAVAQIALSIIDWVVAASVLYVLLPDVPGVTFPLFLGVFVSAMLVAVTSHVPGGIGVFEWAALGLLQGKADKTVILGALAAWRVLYYLLPLAVGTVIFAGHEVVRHHGIRSAVGVGAKTSLGGIRKYAPRLLGFATFVAGAILLVSGSRPAVPERMRAIAEWLPLSLLETSHFVGSLIGVALLLLAAGLHQRIRFAWGAALTLLGLGAIASLLKGFDWEEACGLLLIALLLVPCRSRFTRHSSLLHAPFQPGWVAGLLAVFIGVAALVHFSFTHADWLGDQWWRFAADAEAPRAQRALVGAAVFALAFGVLRLLKPAQPTPAPADADELGRAAALARASGDSLAKLALLGDKSLFWSATKKSFLMYAIEGRCWIALGDPVGDPDEAAELVRRFHEAAHTTGGRTVFYEVLGDRAPLYLDVGLRLHKLGEEARVSLPDFELKGNRRRKLRQNSQKAEAAGATFELIPKEGVAALLPELRRISDAWLAKHGGREKGFSVGYFDEEYLGRFPLALIRVAGAIAAFANVWIDEPDATTSREELSIDLMRFTDAAPSGTMDLLFVKLLELGREKGYRWFNFGMAPLSGLQEGELAPVWHKLAGTLFRHGESLYHFQGLRQYKEKFDPDWRPRYLASPGGVALPAVLTDIARRISRGPDAVQNRQLTPK